MASDFRAVRKQQEMRARVERLAETIARHEAAGDFKQAAQYAALFVEEHDVEATA
jgi:hypothetical protein